MKAPHAVGFGAVFAAIALGHSACAVEPRPLQVGAELGYALPGGSLEQGSRVSDVTFGLLRLGVDGAYRLHPLFSAGLTLRYGLAIPTLCDTGGDCVASLGHDIDIGVLGRWHVGQWGSFEPDLDLALGYEWFTSKLVDSGATSSRGFRGFEAGLHAHGQFRISRIFSLGPTLDLSGGIFEHASLDAPGIEDSRETDGATVHFWAALGVRAVGAW